MDVQQLARILNVHVYWNQDPGSFQSVERWKTLISELFFFSFFFFNIFNVFFIYLFLQGTLVLKNIFKKIKRKK